MIEGPSVHQCDSISPPQPPTIGCEQQVVYTWPITYQSICVHCLFLLVCSSVLYVYIRTFVYNILCVGVNNFDRVSKIYPPQLLDAEVVEKGFTK